MADKAKAAGLDPEQLKGLLSRCTGPDGKLDLSGLLSALTHGTTTDQEMMSFSRTYQ